MDSFNNSERSEDGDFDNDIPDSLPNMINKLPSVGRHVKFNSKQTFNRSLAKFKLAKINNKSIIIEILCFAFNKEKMFKMTP